MDNPGHPLLTTSGLYSGYPSEYPKIWTPIHSHFFGSNHKFAISSDKGGELWVYREANMSGKEKSAYIIALQGVYAEHSSVDMMAIRAEITLTVKPGLKRGYVNLHPSLRSMSLLTP
jgi:hypothetical protein